MTRQTPPGLLKYEMNSSMTPLRYQTFTKVHSPLSETPRVRCMYVQYVTWHFQGNLSQIKTDYKQPHHTYVRPDFTARSGLQNCGEGIVDLC